MAVPDFQSLMRPLLVSLADGGDHTIKSIRADLAEHFSLTQADIEELIPSGRVTTIQNRVGWAATYLYRTKLIDRPGRAVYRITDRGRQVLKQNPDGVDLKVLSQFNEFEEFRQAKPTSTAGKETPVTTGADEQTPEERIDTAHREMRSALSAELLDRVSTNRQSSSSSSSWMCSMPWDTAGVETTRLSVSAKAATRASTG